MFLLIAYDSSPDEKCSSKIFGFFPPDTLSKIRSGFSTAGFYKLPITNWAIPNNHDQILLYNKNILLRKVLKSKESSFYYFRLKDKPLFPKCWLYIKDFHQQIKSKCDQDKLKAIWHLFSLQIPKYLTFMNPQLLSLYLMTSRNIFS